MSSPNYYQSLKKSMIVILLLVSFTPLILIALITNHQFRTAYQSKVLAQLEELVMKHAQNIDSFLNEKLADIRVLASANTYEQLGSEEYLQQLLLILQEQHGGVFVDLGFVNDQGTQVSYAGPFKLTQARYADAAWFKEAMQTDYYTSDVFLGLRGLPHFVVAVKVEGAGRQWILRSTIDFLAFNQLVEHVSVGKTGLAYIVNQKGEFQTKPRLDLPKDIMTVLDYLWQRGAGDQTDAIHTASDVDWRALRCQETSSGATINAFVLDCSGDRIKPAIYVTTKLKKGDWILVYQQDEEDAFADLYHARRLGLLVLVLGGVAIVITALFVAKEMVSRVALADFEKEKLNEQVIESGKLASLGELAAGIAHEINNPVAIMVEEAGWVEDLLEEDEFGETENVLEVRRALKQIRTQGGRCKQITHKLLSFARRTDAKVHEVQVNDLIEELVRLSEQRARYSSVTIRTDLAPNLPRVAVSPSEMQQVFLNFINNAIDAMEKKGGELAITTRQDDHIVLLQIADSGEGIPKANLQRIFDPFFTTKPVGKGTGLGLSICYGIINRMGGQISVESAVGVGTTFHIRLPALNEGGDSETDLACGGETKESSLRGVGDDYPALKP